jgi:hypothetical protein
MSHWARLAGSMIPNAKAANKNMSGLDGLGWPNPEDEPKPTKSMSDTPETDATIRRYTVTYGMIGKYVRADFARKLERERDEARADAEKAKAYKKVLKTTNANLKRERDEAVNNYETAQLLSVRVGEQRDAVTLRLGNTQERMFDAEMQRDRLIKSVEPLKYWRDISECDCSNPLPQGGCLRCDLNRILKTTNPNEL